jgi:UDP-N-acetylenolpyruvoylglucosamine reductase
MPELTIDRINFKTDPALAKQCLILDAETGENLCDLHVWAADATTGTLQCYMTRPGHGGATIIEQDKATGELVSYEVKRAIRIVPMPGRETIVRTMVEGRSWQPET